MIDCSDRKRLAETGNEFSELLADEKLNDVPIMIFANKQDLENVLKVSEVAEAIGLVKLKDRTWQIQECSALEGTGIKVYQLHCSSQIQCEYSWKLNNSIVLSFQEGMDWVCKNIKKN